MIQYILGLLGAILGMVLFIVVCTGVQIYFVCRDVKDWIVRKLTNAG